MGSTPTTDWGDAASSEPVSAEEYVASLVRKGLIVLALTLVVSALLVTGCTQSDADVAAKNISKAAEQYDKWADELHAVAERARELLAEADTYGDQIDLTAEGAVSDLRRHADYWLDCAAEARRDERDA